MVDRLILDEIADRNGAEETRRLLDTPAKGRTQAAQSILLSILDHISEYGYSPDNHSPDSHESLLRVACDAAIVRLSGAADAVTPSIVSLLGLMCVNIRLLEARFREPGPADQRDRFAEQTQRYCEEHFANLPVADAVHALYAPTRSAARARQGGYTPSPEEEQRKAELDFWQDIDFGTAKYHESGTTSFILDCDGARPVDESGAHRHYALKCVLFPWNKLTTIATATDEYAEFYGRHRTPEIVVQPYASTARWVLMPFQEGKTLYEELAHFESDKKNRSVRKRVDKALSIGRMLIKTLDRLAGGAEITADHKQRQHQDLSPGNIILAPDDRVRLIDLGPNHLYTRQIGITEHDDAAYVAPEIKNQGWSEVADVYSLGMILIRIICGYAPRDGRVPDEVLEHKPAAGPADRGPRRGRPGQATAADPARPRYAVRLQPAWRVLRLHGRSGDQGPGHQRRRPDPLGRAPAAFIHGMADSAGPLAVEQKAACQRCTTGKLPPSVYLHRHTQLVVHFHRYRIHKRTSPANGTWIGAAR